MLTREPLCKVNNNFDKLKIDMSSMVHGAYEDGMKIHGEIFANDFWHKHPLVVLHHDNMANIYNNKIVGLLKDGSDSFEVTIECESRKYSNGDSHYIYPVCACQNACRDMFL